MIEIRQSNILTNIDEILNLELLIKNKVSQEISLPQDYINFLLEYNGCNFENETIKYLNYNPEIELLILSSVKDMSEYLY